MQYLMIVLQTHIFWFMKDTFCAHMLPVKRCSLFGWKWSFSHHCNALRHIKEMDCSVPAALRGPPTWQSLVTFGQHVFILLKRLSLTLVWLDAEEYQQKWFSGLYITESIWGPKRQSGYISPPCLKGFGLVLLSDVVTHSVATDRWADGSLSASYSL